MGLKLAGNSKISTDICILLTLRRYRFYLIHFHAELILKCLFFLLVIHSFQAQTLLNSVGKSLYTIDSKQKVSYASIVFFSHRYDRL